VTPDFDLLVSRIRGSIPVLSAQLQTGAAYILAHPEEIAVSSLRKVSVQANVHPMALVRLVRRLGYPGWNELREVCVGALTTGPSLAARAGALESGNSSDAPGYRVCLAQNDALVATLAGHDVDNVARAAELLRNAAHVHVAGFRWSFLVAFGLACSYRLLRNSVSLIEGKAGTLETELGAIGRRDATVVVSFAPYASEAVEVAERTRSRGARLIALTDSEVSPVAPKADQILLFSTGSPSSFPTLVGAIAMAELLVLQLRLQEG